MPISYERVTYGIASKPAYEDYFIRGQPWPLCSNDNQQYRSREVYRVCKNQAETGVFYVPNLPINR